MKCFKLNFKCIVKSQRINLSRLIKISKTLVIFINNTKRSALNFPAPHSHFSTALFPGRGEDRKEWNDNLFKALRRQECLIIFPVGWSLWDFGPSRKFPPSSRPPHEYIQWVVARRKMNGKSRDDSICHTRGLAMNFECH